MDAPNPYFGGIPISDLWRQRHEIPEQKWIIDQFLPIGFSIIAGREKCGKSLMTFGTIACSIALGVPAFNALQTLQGTVLYFALEENLGTIMTRMGRLFSKPSDIWVPPDALRLFLSESIASWTDQAIGQLEALIEEHPGTCCVVIDTLRLLAPPKRVGASSTDYDFEYQVGTQLQQLALKHGIAILALHHTTKTVYADVFDSIGGTAWTKSAEMLAVIERDGLGMKLHTRGRSLPTSCWRMEQDQDTLLWTIAASSIGDDDAKSRRRTSEIERLAVQDVFEDNMHLRFSDVKNRFMALGHGESSAGRWLTARVTDGSLVKLDDGSGYKRVDIDNEKSIDQTSLFDADETSVTANDLFDRFPPLPPPALSMEMDEGGGELQPADLF
ncbi:MAG: AAA family ATPase [bacterium]|nr:AAA family ATPase [bacterium]